MLLKLYKSSHIVLGETNTQITRSTLRPVVWSETVGLSTRPVWDQQIGLGPGLVSSGLGLGPTG